MAAEPHDLTDGFDSLFGAHRKGPYVVRPDAVIGAVDAGRLVTLADLHFGDPNRLIVVGGEPGTGKSVVTVQLTAEQEQLERKCLYFNAQGNGQTQRFMGSDYVDTLSNLPLSQLHEDAAAREQIAVMATGYDFVVIDSVDAHDHKGISTVVNLATTVRAESEASVLVTCTPRRVAPGSLVALDDLSHTLCDQADVVALLTRKDDLDVDASFLKTRYTQAPADVAMALDADARTLALR